MILFLHCLTFGAKKKIDDEDDAGDAGIRKVTKLDVKDPKNVKNYRLRTLFSRL